MVDLLRLFTYRADSKIKKIDILVKVKGQKINLRGCELINEVTTKRKEKQHSANFLVNLCVNHLFLLLAYA